MGHVTKSINLDVPVRVAYDRWTQFEEFPRFMEGVHEVRQLDDRRLHWKATVGGREKEWDAEIVEQVPDQVIAWRSTDGTPNSGRVTFQEKGPQGSVVMVAMEYETDGVAEAIGEMAGFGERQVEDELVRFKELVESRQSPTGAWRGEIHGDRTDG